MKILPITSGFGLMKVNSYLLKTDSGFVLIDTGLRGHRRVVEKKIRAAGCRPGDLNLILITHGDFDHIGNCRYFREEYRTRIAMHRGDIGMAQHGSMFYGRRKPNPIMAKIAGMVFTLPEPDRFSPDIDLNERTDLSEYGLNARILEIPGHSSGSIAVLTHEGDLFCGDLFGNSSKPK